uniref:Uncharacterized protein n=1 Tax=Avena sativa TaxID=4498 RepID=A0ACD5XAD0_AVESA
MSLPDDLFVEIFPRLKDIAGLFRCATVCKAWRDLIVTKPSFLRRCLSEACPFPGFFTQQQRRKAGSPVPCFVPGPRPVPVLDRRRLLSSFVPGMGDVAVPLVSRHGLLLVRVRRLLIVCDPLRGTFKPLPHLDHHWGTHECFTGYAMLTAAAASDCSSSSSCMKVMILVVKTQYPMHYYDLYTYSSSSSSSDGDGESGWKSCSGSAWDMVRLLQHSAAVCQGAPYWFSRGASGSYVTSVSTKTGDIYTRKVVNPRLCSLLGDPSYDEPYVSSSSANQEGKLVFLFLRLDGTQLHIHDGTKSHTIMLLVPPSSHSQHMNNFNIGQGVEYRFLGEKNGMVILKDNHKRIYVVAAIKTKTGLMQEITDCPRDHGLSRREIVPMEIDWPAWFLSRLASV